MKTTTATKRYHKFKTAVRTVKPLKALLPAASRFRKTFELGHSSKESVVYLLD